MPPGKPIPTKKPRGAAVWASSTFRRGNIHLESQSNSFDNESQSLPGSDGEKINDEPMDQLLIRMSDELDDFLEQVRNKKSQIDQMESFKRLTQLRKEFADFVQNVSNPDDDSSSSRVDSPSPALFSPFSENLSHLADELPQHCFQSSEDQYQHDQPDIEPSPEYWIRRQLDIDDSRVMENREMTRPLSSDSSDVVAPIKGGDTHTQLPRSPPSRLTVSQRTFANPSLPAMNRVHAQARRWNQQMGMVTPQGAKKPRSEGREFDIQRSIRDVKRDAKSSKHDLSFTKERKPRLEEQNIPSESLTESSTLRNPDQLEYEATPSVSASPLPPEDNLLPSPIVFLPRGYATVLEWAKSMKELPTLNHVLYQLRNTRVASFAEAGKARWGRPEIGRAVFETDEMRRVIEMTYSTGQEQSSAMIGNPHDGSATPSRQKQSLDWADDDDKLLSGDLPTKSDALQTSATAAIRTAEESTLLFSEDVKARNIFSPRLPLRWVQMLHVARQQQLSLPQSALPNNWAALREFTGCSPVPAATNDEGKPRTWKSVLDWTRDHAALSTYLPRGWGVLTAHSLPTPPLVMGEDERHAAVAMPTKHEGEQVFLGDDASPMQISAPRLPLRWVQMLHVARQQQLASVQSDLPNNWAALREFTGSSPVPAATNDEGKPRRWKGVLDWANDNKPLTTDLPTGWGLLKASTLPNVTSLNGAEDPALLEGHSPSSGFQMLEIMNTTEDGSRIPSATAASEKNLSITHDRILEVQKTGPVHMQGSTSTELLSIKSWAKSCQIKSHEKVDIAPRVASGEDLASDPDWSCSSLSSHRISHANDLVVDLPASAFRSNANHIVPDHVTTPPSLTEKLTNEWTQMNREKRESVAETLAYIKEELAKPLPERWNAMLDLLGKQPEVGMVVPTKMTDRINLPQRRVEWRTDTIERSEEGALTPPPLEPMTAETLSAQTSTPAAAQMSKGFAASMDQLAREWAAMNQSKNLVQPQSHPPPFSKPTTSQTSTPVAVSSRRSSISLDQLAREWGAMNREQVAFQSPPLQPHTVQPPLRKEHALSITEQLALEWSKVNKSKE